VPYSIDYKNKCVHKKVTKIKNGKKVTMRGEKVGCTKGSLDNYIAALQIHAENKKTMKKTVKEQDQLQKPIDGSLNQVFAVQKPYAGCELTSLVKPIDPLLGIGAGHSIVPDQIHAVFADEPTAQKIATELYETHMEGQQALEEKKEVATKKLKSVIDAIEKKRKEHMDMAKEDPKNASKHREQIAIITDKLDDLMNKLEKIEKSKKPIEEKLDESFFRKLKENIKIQKSIKEIENTSNVHPWVLTTMEELRDDLDFYLGKNNQSAGWSIDFKLLKSKMNQLIKMINTYNK
jgi:hypothetical protein